MFDWLIDLLHSPWLPLVLFFGAFGDAFIATSLFVFGEVVFVGTGYAMASLGQYHFLILIWLGAFLGDVVSFLIGRHYGPSVLTKWIRRRATWRLNFLRAKRLLRRRGLITVFSARLAGPVSKFMPFIAGSLAMPLKYFMVASIGGVIVGSAQFILTGWLLAKGLEQRDIWQQYVTQQNILLTALFIVLSVLIWRRVRYRQRDKS